MKPKADEALSIQSPLGIIAGNGSFPLEVARNARAQGIRVVAALHREESHPNLASEVDSALWVRVGELGAIIRFFKREKVRDVVFAGGIKRVNLFGGVKLDLRGLALLSKLVSRKDDAVLRAIAEEIEKEGMRVVAPHLLLDKSVAPEGTLTHRGLSVTETEDAKVGFATARVTGDLDIGQTVIVFEGVVTAIEAAEGTDAALRRAGDVARGKGGVVVKLCKRHQDVRLDLPTVGVRTIEEMKQSGLTALVLESGRTIILDPVETISRANTESIAIVSFS